jgi:cobalamin synthase
MSAPAASPRSPRGIVAYALVLCVLAAVAAVLSFVKGSWFGIVWIMLAGVSSNMAWYYARRARKARTARTGTDAAGSTAPE